MPGATVAVSVKPTTITVGQSTVVTWSSNTGTNCTASGAWSGSLAATGSQTVTPTAAGAETFTLNCASGSYGGGTGSATLTVNAATAFSLTKLVADTAGGTAANTDTNLVNPWACRYRQVRPRGWRIITPRLPLCMTATASRSRMRLLWW